MEERQAENEMTRNKEGFRKERAKEKQKKVRRMETGEASGQETGKEKENMRRGTKNMNGDFKRKRGHRWVLELG